MHKLTLDSTEVALVITPSSDTVEIHSTVLLVCVAQGDPSPSISWDFEGSIITNETSDRVRMTLKHFTSCCEYQCYIVVNEYKIDCLLWR